MTQHEATHRIPGWMVHRACARMVRPALASGDRARCAQPQDRRDARGAAQAKPDRGADVAVEDRAMTPAVILVVLAIALAAGGADATTKRSHAARSAFERSHPCPATGKKTGACPGYVIDHIKPLACGGADRPSNMQWQTVAEGKAKDKWERKQCSK